MTDDPERGRAMIDDQMEELIARLAADPALRAAVLVRLNRHSDWRSEIAHLDWDPEEETAP
jgi:hypothetical protein